jgi:hypothetical protein
MKGGFLRVRSENLKTYIYPSNLSAKATLWMWTLRDMGIIGSGLILSALAITALRFVLPLAAVCAYAFLAIQLDDVSVKDYISWAWKFLISGQQHYEWGLYK